MGARGPKPRHKSEFRLPRNKQRRADKDPSYLPEHPITRPRGLLHRAKRRVALYEGELALRTIAYEAFITVFGFAPHKRIRGRCTQSAKRLHEALHELQELEEAARDCAGVSNQEKEYVVAMRAQKFGTEGWGPKKQSAWLKQRPVQLQHKDHNLKAREFKARRAKRLERQGFDLFAMMQRVKLPFIKDPATDSRDKISAMKSLVDVIKQMGASAKILHEEQLGLLEAKNRGREENVARVRAIKERDALVKDVAALNCDPIAVCGVWADEVIKDI